MRKFKQKIKEFLEEHFRWFLVIVLLVFCTISITITFICVKPMSDEQIVYCQEAAKDIYAQDSIIYEAPDNVDVTITDTSIQVGMKGVRGSVISKLQNGELVFAYTPEIGYYIFIGALVGILSLCVFIIFFMLTLKVKERRRRKRVER
jgi:hypothetical protein